MPRIWERSSATSGGAMVVIARVCPFILYCGD
jgi:hypothetical protein